MATWHATSVARRTGDPGSAISSRFTELFHQLGFTAGQDLHGGGAYHAIQRSELIRPIQSPPRLDHRYLHEDVGWGLVPWMHLAAAAGSPAPTITALTHLAGMMNGIDYPREGLTLERMGLAGKTPAQIRAHVGAPTADPAGAPAPNPEVRTGGYPRHAASVRSAPSAAR